MTTSWNTMTTKEIPLLFCAEMVKALLDGRKVQTRRIVKPQPATTEAFPGDWIRNTPNLAEANYRLKPGMRFWVRETWANHPEDDDLTIYRADHKGDYQWTQGFVWKPSIFMPRSRSRIQGTITAVTVQHLQQITEEDAKAEGVALSPVYVTSPKSLGPHVKSFAELWNTLHAEDGFSWANNPYVYCLTLKRD